jgi:hypothetical protein
MVVAAPVTFVLMAIMSKDFVLMAIMSKDFVLMASIQMPFSQSVQKYWQNLTYYIKDLCQNLHQVHTILFVKSAEC